MVVVLLLAIGFAGLRTASALWASALFTFTLTLFTAALLGVATSRGRSRMTFLGFSIFGWAYLLTTFWLWPVPNGVTAPPFLTKALLDAVQPSSNTPTVMTIDRGPAGEMSTEPPPMVPTTVPGTRNVVTTAPYTGRVVNLHHYRRIGHILAAILFGLLGSLLGRTFYALGEASDGQHPNGERKTGRVR
ncbi:hypothetical protein ACYOEI_27900 [Singulisphaera rosea]